MEEERARRLAAAAPTDEDTAPEPTADGGEDVDQLLERWAHWRKTRRYYAPAPASGSLLGKLRGATRASRPPPDAACNATMAALHMAIIGQPLDALDVRVFWLYYGGRAASVKTMAESLGISRGHFYVLRNAAVRRILIMAKLIEAGNLAAGAALPHRSTNHSQPQTADGQGY